MSIASLPFPNLNKPVGAPPTQDQMIADLIRMSPAQRAQFAQEHMDDPISLSAAKYVDNQIKSQAQKMIQPQGPMPPVNQSVVQSIGAPMPSTQPMMGMGNPAQQPVNPMQQQNEARLQLPGQAAAQANELPEDSGIARLPVKMNFADGGIVGYADGGVARFDVGGQTEADRRALLSLPYAAADVALSPFRAGLNLAGMTASGLENFANRAANAVTGSNLSTNLDYNPNYDLGEYYNRLNNPKKSLAEQQRETQKAVAGQGSMYDLNDPSTWGKRATTATDPRVEGYVAPITPNAAPLPKRPGQATSGPVVASKPKPQAAMIRTDIPAANPMSMDPAQQQRAAVDSLVAAQPTMMEDVPTNAMPEAAKPVAKDASAMTSDDWLALAAGLLSNKSQYASEALGSGLQSLVSGRAARKAAESQQALQAAQAKEAVGKGGYYDSLAAVTGPEMAAKIRSLNSEADRIDAIVNMYPQMSNAQITQLLASARQDEMRSATLQAGLPYVGPEAMTRIKLQGAQGYGAMATGRYHDTLAQELPIKMANMTMVAEAKVRGMQNAADRNQGNLMLGQINSIMRNPGVVGTPDFANNMARVTQLHSAIDSLGANKDGGGKILQLNPATGRLE
jgi:hypothetical protein